MIAAMILAATVTLDVKDEDVRVILKSMQKQCAIKNLVIDRDVQGKGTFILNKVSCETAFDIVTRTMGLQVEHEPNSVVVVEKRER